MAKIYRVIQIELNQLVSENVRVITDLPAKRYHSIKHFWEFLPTRWRQKSTAWIWNETSSRSPYLCIIHPVVYPSNAFRHLIEPGPKVTCLEI